MPKKIYIQREKDAWYLTNEITKELASIKHLKEDITSGGEPYDSELEVQEGIYIWDNYKSSYIKMTSEDNTTNGMEKIKTRVSKTNTVSMIFLWMGIAVMAVAFISGIVLSQNDNYSDENMNVLFTMWGSGFISGMMFIGFSEIIKLLQQISDK